MTDCYYAVQLNDRYWLGCHSQDGSGISGSLCPSQCDALIIPSDADEEQLEKIRDLAKEHGGKLVKIKVVQMVDEFLEGV